MKKNIFLLVVLTLGICLLYVLLHASNETDHKNASLKSAKDSLEQNLAVFWPEKNCYFRVNSGRWEYSKNHFEIPFKPVASEEAARELIRHFKYDTNNLHTDANHQQKLTNNTKILKPRQDEIKKEAESKLIVINYKGKSYKLKAGFTSKEGLVYNDAKLRFYNNKWEKSDNYGTSWKAVQEKDITFLLSKEATEIKKAAPKQEETAEEQKKKAYDAQVQQIKKQGYKEGTPPTGQTLDTKTLTNPQGQTVNFWKLKVEPKTEVKQGGGTWWDQFLDSDGNVDINKVCRKIDEIKKRQSETGRIRDKVIAVAKRNCW